MAESLYPIGVLIEELKNDELSRRISSIQNLSTIAVALGHERTRSELIPYLSELLDDEEEFLVELARTIPSLFAHVGGVHYAHHLFEPLEQLCQVEDSSVRAESAKSFKNVLGELDHSLVEVLVVSCVNRLSNTDWYAAKAGAAQLIPAILPCLSENSQSELIDTFKSFVVHEHPQVRRSAVENIYLIEKESKQIELLNIAIADREDTIKLIALELLLKCKYSGLLSLFQSLLNDESWRVRYMLATNFGQLVDIFSSENEIDSLKPYLYNYFKDEEPEVKSAICSHLKDLFRVFTSEEVISHIIPSLNNLLAENENVKISLVASLPELSPLIGAEATESLLIPLFQSLIQDGSSDLKFCALTDLESLSGVINSDLLARTIMPYIKVLATDKNWRIRRQMCEQLANMARQLGQEFFEQYLLKHFIFFLDDSAHSVREAGVTVLKEVSHTYGALWAQTKIIEPFLSEERNESYTKRMTSINMARELSSSMTPEFFNSRVVRYFVGFCSDAVPNIRMNACKAVRETHALIDPGHIQTVKQAVKNLTEDNDCDVKIYAEQALEVLG